MRFIRLKESERGFTIIELLVVIVVIGILASITIVAYNGIQQRAKSAAWVSALDQWSDIIRMHQALNGSYPSTGGYQVCLGSGFPAANGYAADQCARSVPTTFFSASVSSSLNSTLKPTIGVVPQTILPSIQTIDPAASNREVDVRGLTYGYDGSTSAYIEYYLDRATGSSGCIGGDTVAYSGYADGSRRCRRYFN